MKVFTKKEILPVFLVLISFAAGFYLYPRLPDYIPSHWNIKGEIDAWSNKDFTVLFFPSLIFVLYVLMTFLPKIDPLRKNYSYFEMPYFWFRTVSVVFFLAIYFYTISAGFGARLNINFFALTSFSVLFIMIGLFMSKIKQNYFVGIRTPWTISSEKVWDATHKFGSKVYIAAGIVSLLGIFFLDYAFFIFISAAILASVISIAYSYFVFKKLKGFDD